MSVFITGRQLNYFYEKVHCETLRWGGGSSNYYKDFITIFSNYSNPLQKYWGVQAVFGLSVYTNMNIWILERYSLKFASLLMEFYWNETIVNYNTVMLSGILTRQWWCWSAYTLVGTRMSSLPTLAMTRRLETSQSCSMVDT